MTDVYLKSVRSEYMRYKTLTERAIAQLSDDELHWKYHETSNTIAVLMQHLAGNTMSRFTDFLSSDGEKDWRDRDGEFEERITDRAELMAYWEKGWACLFDLIDSLTADDLERTVYVRNEPHTVIEAFNRSLPHHAYHVGQIVHVAIQIKGDAWQSLSIPRGESKAFNEAMFAKNRRDQN